MNLQRGPMPNGKDRQQAVDSMPYPSEPVVVPPRSWLQGGATLTWYASIGQPFHPPGVGQEPDQKRP
jgi:hypothetical protein